MNVVNSIMETVGATPLLRLNNLSAFANLAGEVLVKMESMNPGGSVKDRIALNMIQKAVAEGLLTKNRVLLEATSGNTGIGLAMVAASLGFGIVLVMPETMSVERRKLLRAYGADILLTPGSEAMGGAVRKAEAMAAEDDKYLLMQQFVNQANPEIHYQTTAPEIYDALEGKIHAFVAGVGTGGTISGVGKYLKEKSADIEVIAVEPVDSPVLSGGAAGPHTIQGIGAGFIPEVLDRSVVDRIITVSSTDAINCARLLGEKEGILGGISAGANVHVALELAKGEEYRGKTIVTVFCDTGERYLSTPLFA